MSVIGHKVHVKTVIESGDLNVFPIDHFIGISFAKTAKEMLYNQHQKCYREVFGKVNSVAE